MSADRQKQADRAEFGMLTERWLNEGGRDIIQNICDAAQSQVLSATGERELIVAQQALRLSLAFKANTFRALVEGLDAKTQIKAWVEAKPERKSLININWPWM